jgi:hypothetical protein
MRVRRVGDFTDTSLSGMAYPSLQGIVTPTRVGSMPTALYFAEEQTLRVEEDLPGVEDALNSAAQNPGGMAHLTANGERVLVNPAQITWAQGVRTAKGRVRVH